ncbi:MAG: amino acid permease [Candidatus Rokubacteria bacterium 13_2_20CM_2_64_8]|nr:MAG: amino acid permease [Candidatus Rokubacteria bacterium 13_2_20CM_2_64_8]
MPLAQARHERLGKSIALAVFSSDAMSSVAYATEEILLILVLAGAAAAHLANPIAVSIAGLLIIVAISYQQTIHAYPNGGGSYIVAHDNLGTVPGLVAAAALLVDYVLTVAVSVAAGVAAITSALPSLQGYKVVLGVLFVAAIALANIRGVRESGRIFAVPTYFFIVSFGVLLVGGFYRMVTGTLEPVTEPPPAAMEALTWFLVLRAFSSGCTAMTGTEAISNGIPAFRAPESRNAAITLAWMAGILATLFVGLTVLASALHVLPSDTETVVSQIARRVFGSGLLYYLIQAATALILVLAANTSFADFPRLSSLLARDRFVPRQFATLGERLVFSNGILVLAGFAALLLVAFRGETHALIPLYAVGVFISFTLSQSGMVHYWWTRRGPGWRHRLAINGTGALATGIVTIVIAATKFTHGAWIVVIVIPMLVVTFLAMHRHYEEVAEALTLEGLEGPPEFQHTVLVLVGDVHRGVVRAVQYARTLAPNATVRAVYVETDPGRTAKLEEKWGAWGLGVPLVVLTSPYRSLLRPLLDYIDHIQARGDDQMVTIVVPEFLPRRWWQHVLHNQTALLVKGALLFRKNTVVADVPYLLKR